MYKDKARRIPSIPSIRNIPIGQFCNKRDLEGVVRNLNEINEMVLRLLNKIPTPVCAKPPRWEMDANGRSGTWLQRKSRIRKTTRPGPTLERARRRKDKTTGAKRKRQKRGRRGFKRLLLEWTVLFCVVCRILRHPGRPTSCPMLSLTSSVLSSAPHSSVQPSVVSAFFGSCACSEMSRILVIYLPMSSALSCAVFSVLCRVLHQDCQHSS